MIARKAIYEVRVGIFMSNGVARYKIEPPCKCGNGYELIDDYTRGVITCHVCKEILFEEIADAYVFLK
jgi:hypothetical protein